MGRIVLKDSSGHTLFAPVEKKAQLFAFAEALGESCGIEAVVNSTRDTETGGKSLRVYFNCNKSELPDGVLDVARQLWREHICP